MDRGVVYIAFGEKFVKQAAYSARTLKEKTSFPTTLFTDRSTESGFFDKVIMISPNHKRAKVDHIFDSPYEKTLYLDSDTRVVGDISDIFDALERFDICAAQDYARKRSRWAEVIPEYADIPYVFPEHNAGVMAFRKSPRTERFFALWRELFYKYITQSNGADQPTFRIALWMSDVMLHALPTEYNVRNAALRKRMAVRARTPQDRGLLAPRILHWHGLDETPGFLDRFSSKKRPLIY